MDFEKYIGKEKQLLSKLEREQAALSAYERRGNAGTLDLAEDEIKLIQSGRFVKQHIEAASEASKALDERAVKLKEMQDELNTKNAELQLRISEWENSFDGRYNELMNKVDSEVKALEIRNKDLIAFTRAQENIFTARNTELTSKIEAAETGFKQSSDSAYADLKQMVTSLKDAQKDFESSINEKLEQDKQTIDRIKYMLSTMSDIIKT
jgi:hypothetical protein